MTSRPIRRLKPVIYPILFFFCWTNLGIYNIAYAASSGVSQDLGVRSQKKDKSAEEKFQETLERLRYAVGKEDNAEIKAERVEIEKLDIEIKKQFKETEKKIKDLPEEIKQRHRDFVKKYEENLNTLKGHLDGIEKAKSKAEEKVEVEKAKTFLEKTKPPKRHVPLDPNKLPHRTIEPKFKEPRLKKEEFEPQRAQTSSPIMVAANGPLTGLVSELPTYQSDDMLLALNTTDLPTSADLSETIEVKFTDAIKAKAQELGYSPVKIYEWVRNNIEYVPTYASIQGADMCLQTKQCNDIDTASLLIALLRASNISARYVYGTIELPIDRVMNWVGGFTNEQAAVNFIASGGVPIKAYASGGKIAKVQMEHVWVESYVPYGPYSGRQSKLNPSKIWVPLDPSYKQYTYTDGVDFKTAVPFDANSFISQIKSTATINETDGYVTNVDSTLVQTTMTSYQAQLQDYVNQSMPNATVGDILGKKDIKKQELGILPVTLSYKTITTGVKYSEVLDSMRNKITIELTDQYDYLNGQGISYTVSLPEIAGKRVTVSYDPATDNDKNLINSYVEQYATAIPAYMIRLKPVLKIEGNVVATGPETGMGQDATLNLSFRAPPLLLETETHSLRAGDYAAISINPSTITKDVIQKRIDKADFAEPVGEMLHQVGLSYWGEYEAFNAVIAKTHKVATSRYPSEGVVSSPVSITYSWGVPFSARYKSRSIDVKRDVYAAFSLIGDASKVFSYATQSGVTASSLEGIVFDQLFGRNIGDGISAVRLLELANSQGIPIYQITSSNLSTVLPKLSLSDDLKTDIQNAINAGKTVKVQQQTLTHNGWTGAGYIIQDPTTGVGAYMISGGLAGGGSNTGASTVIPLPQIPLTGASAIVIGSLASNIGSVVTTEAGVVVGIATTLSASQLLAIAGLIAIIFATIKPIVVKQRTEPIWEVYRHYTTFYRKESIIMMKVIFPSFLGDLGPGVYLTKLFKDPIIDKQEIAETLRMDINNIETYLDIEINKNLIYLQSDPKYPQQYLWFLLPLYLDGIEAKIVQ